jgi:hypothetical protein
MAALAQLDIEVRIHGTPNEVPDPGRFTFSDDVFLNYKFCRSQYPESQMEEP